MRVKDTLTCQRPGVEHRPVVSQTCFMCDLFGCRQHCRRLARIAFARVLPHFRGALWEPPECEWVPAGLRSLKATTAGVRNTNSAGISPETIEQNMHSGIGESLHGAATLAIPLPGLGHEIGNSHNTRSFRTKNTRSQGQRDSLLEQFALPSTASTLRSHEQ